MGRVSGLRHPPAALPAGKTPYQLYIVGWVGPHVRPERVRKTLPRRDSIPRPSSTQRSRYTDYDIQAYLFTYYGSYYMHFAQKSETINSLS